MKLRLAFVLMLAFQQMPGTSFGQTLTARLTQEDSQTLANAARQRGNAVRGAVLFAEQKLGCANCHAAGRDDLLGPDLTRLGDVEDGRLIEAILQPSKVLRKGYETTVLLLGDGRTLNGRVIEETTDQLVIRDTTEKRQLHRIKLADIDERSVSKVSNMPAKLADQLKGRQQFLDLARYVIEVVEAGSSTDQTVRTRGGGKISEKLRGLVLLNELNCAQCHEYKSPAVSLPSAKAPNLEWLSGRVDPNHIARFISDPAAAKPGSRMPHMLGSVAEAEREAAANELTHYIASLSDRRFARTRPSFEAAAKGRELFHSIGCVACHSPRDDQHKELISDSVPLGAIGAKYNLETLVEFLKDPHAARPSGQMPNMKLTHWEAGDLAVYLLSDSKVSATAGPFVLDNSLAAAGEKRFRTHGCAQCHEVPGQAANALRSLDTSKLDAGCLSGRTGAWPRYSLSAADTAAIRAALSSTPKLNAEDHIAVHLTSQRCLNCHTRGDLGGIADNRDSYFQTINPNLGPQGRVPPPLTGVGAKLKPQWMRQVLVLGRGIRPYVKTRMPKFEAANVESLIDRFQELDHQTELPSIKHAVKKQDMRKAGYELAGTGGLNCIVCHTFQGKPAATMPAVDLTNMAERLHKDWFRRYMRDPQRLSPNTVMPSFWPGGKAIRKDVLAGDPDQQVEALWEWLLEGRQARAPRGLIRKPMELLATDEAVMLRRSYQNIGKRGIGVGYPLQVNIAFDAEQLRLAMIWKGKFLDPGGVWRSQGHGRARPLSRPTEFAKGPDIELGEPKWKPEDDRPATHQFKGYSLDSKRRPKFEYSIDGVSVEDYFVDVTDDESKQSVLRRTITLRSQANATVSFRIANGKKIESANGWFEIDGRIRVRVLDSNAASIVDAGEGQELRMKLNVTGGAATVTVVEYGWKS